MANYARGRNELSVGTLALVAVLVFVVMFAYLTDRGFTEQRAVLYVKFPTAENLRKNDPVLFRGVDVGKVSDLIFAPDGSVLVKTRLRRAVPLTRDASASLVGVGVFGEQVVMLRDGSRDAQPLVSGDTLLGGGGDGGITERLGALGTQAGRLLSDTTVTLVHGTLAGTTDATLELKQLVATANLLLTNQAVHLNQATANAAQLTSNLNRMSSGKEMTATMQNLEATSANLLQVSGNLETASATLTSILQKVDAGQGTAGRMVNDPALYDRAFLATGALEKLLEDVRENPRKYVTIRVF